MSNSSNSFNDYSQSNAGTLVPVQQNTSQPNVHKAALYYNKQHLKAILRTDYVSAEDKITAVNQKLQSEEAAEKITLTELVQIIKETFLDAKKDHDSNQDYKEFFSDNNVVEEGELYLKDFNAQTLSALHLQGPMTSDEKAEFGEFVIKFAQNFNQQNAGASNVKNKIAALEMQEMAKQAKEMLKELGVEVEEKKELSKPSSDIAPVSVKQLVQKIEKGQAGHSVA